jgi:hypothetical protein
MFVFWIMVIHGVHFSKHAIIVFVLSHVIEIDKTHAEHQGKFCPVIISRIVPAASMYQNCNNINEQG